MSVRYVHTNLIAGNWKELAKFYIDVFDCKEKQPERDIKGSWLDRVSSIDNAHIRGVHLYLPGYGKEGPTLEIFQYSENLATERKEANMEGFAHIAFAVDDVDYYVKKVIDNGGGLVGEIVKAEIEGAGPIHFAYAHDPEGNIIEIQKWG